MNAAFFAQQALLRETDKYPLFVEMLLTAKKCVRVAPSTITCGQLTPDTLQILQTVMHNTHANVWRKM